MVQIQYRGGAWGPLGAISGPYAWDGNDWEVFLGARSTYTAPDQSSAFYYPTLEPGGPAAPTHLVQIYRSDEGQPWMPVAGDTFTMGDGWYYQCAASVVTPKTFASSGYGAVTVANLPISNAATVTTRKLYRTPANGSALKLLATVANNTDTAYLDTVADAALGAAPPATDTSGIRDEGQVVAGSTALVVSSTAPFAADVAGAGGWARVGSLVLRYTGIGAGVLTGIPATGIGAITATIRYGAQVLVQPRLIGIPASGTGALLQPIRKGDTVTIRLERDAPPETIGALAARLKPPGGETNYYDGIIELAVSDSRFGLAELAETLQATLTERKDPHLTVTFESRDPSLQVGRLVTLDLSSPPIHGTFRIQRITFTEIAIAGARGTPAPLRRVEATNRLYTFTDLLRRLRGREGGVP
jgi:hypothetical protein